MPNESSRASRDNLPNAKVFARLQPVLEQAAAAHQSGDDARAHALYVDACEIDGKSIAAWIGRATTASDLDEAIQSWSTASALDPSNETARTGQEESIQRSLDSSSANTAAGLVPLAKAVAESGHKGKAYLLARRATELDPRNDDAWMWRGGLSGDPQELAICLKKALALNPENKRAQTGLQWSAIQQLEFSEANASASEESRKMVERGQDVLKQGDKAQAQVLFKQATELDERNEHAWLWRGSTTPDIDQALICIERALVINPKNNAAREARTWLRVKKLRDSAQHPTQAQSERPSSDVKVQIPRQNYRAARIISLGFLVLALLILVIALLLQRGF